MIDTNKILERLNQLVESETTESLNSWLSEYRSKQRLWDMNEHVAACGLTRIDFVFQPENEMLVRIPDDAQTSGESNYAMAA